MNGRPWWALNRFQRAAHLNPQYVTDFTEFEEGVWTYVGRAHYQMGELEKARKALEQAREEHNEDHLARIYLGLVLMRQGESEQGLREATVADLTALGPSVSFSSQTNLWPGALLQFHFLPTKQPLANVSGVKSQNLTDIFK